MYAHKKLRLRNSCIVNEHKTIDVQGQGPTNINLRLRKHVSG